MWDDLGEALAEAFEQLPAWEAVENAVWIRVEAKEAAVREREQGWRASSAEFPNCTVCDADLTDLPAVWPPRQYCGVKCRDVAASRRYRARKKAKAIV